MALACNGSMIFAPGVQSFGATIFNSTYPSTLQSNFCMTNKMRNVTAGEGITDDTVSLPSGNRHPAAWMPPQKAGALASRNLMVGSGSASGTSLMVKLAEAGLTGSGELTAIGELVVSLIAAINGSGEVSSANLQAFLNLAADVSGSGSLSPATLTGIGQAIAAITGTGTTVGSTLTGRGACSADIVVTGAGLSTANVGQAVWEYLIGGSEAQDVLSAAGSAGDPWITALPGAYAPGTAGHTLGNLLASIGDRLIENGLSQDEVTRIMLAALAGERSGIGTSTETYKSQDGTVDRITFTPTDANGNGSTTVDGS
jgi:hypothetical protein